jgi:hypothetical protein
MSILRIEQILGAQTLKGPECVDIADVLTGCNFRKMLMKSVRVNVWGQIPLVSECRLVSHDTRH